jgi:hypothetical protein
MMLKILSCGVFLLSACAATEPTTVAVDQTGKCMTLEAATGSNRLSRVPCAPTDPSDREKARAQAEALQRDQAFRDQKSSSPMPRPTP